MNDVHVQISPSLYLSSFMGARNAIAWEPDGFFIVNCTKDLEMLSSDGVRVPVDDDRSDTAMDGMLGALPSTIQAIDGALGGGRKVLVHCLAGRQRSAAVVAAYLLFKDPCLTLSGAVQLLREKKRDAFFCDVNFLPTLERFCQVRDRCVGKTVGFHVLSDIHLEQYGDDLPRFLEAPVPDFLCLCGDIGQPSSPSYRRFLEECTVAYKRVFIIPGNHEFYGSDVKSTVDRIKALCAEIAPDKLVCLYNEAVDVKGTDLRVYGTTLWSKIDGAQRGTVQCFNMDFRKIWDWNADAHTRAHEECVRGLQAELASLPPGKRLIVMTHHAPTLQCGSPVHAHSPISSSYKSDLRGLIEHNSHKIAAWMYGHDHYSARLRIGSTLVVSNQAGYPSEKGCSNDFCPRHTVVINSGDASFVKYS